MTLMRIVYFQYVGSKQVQTKTSTNALTSKQENKMHAKLPKLSY
jgi:hypothetical protein